VRRERKQIPGSKFLAISLFVAPQYTNPSRGAGQPELQIFIGVNTQFVKK